MKSTLLLICFLVELSGFSPAVAGTDHVSNEERAGDFLQIAIPAAAYATTFYLDDETGRMQFYKSFATTVATAYTLKYTVKTERPNGYHQSFPSAHTATAFSGAAFVQRRYGWRYGLPLYLAAGYVGWSRIYSDHHYPSDVYAAAALAIAANCYFVEQRPAAAPLVSVWSDGRSVGLALNGHW